MKPINILNQLNESATDKNSIKNLLKDIGEKTGTWCHDIRYTTKGAKGSLYDWVSISYDINDEKYKLTVGVYALKDQDKMQEVASSTGLEVGYIQVPTYVGNRSPRKVDALIYETNDMEQFISKIKEVLKYTK